MASITLRWVSIRHLTKSRSSVDNAVAVEDDEFHGCSPTGGFQNGFPLLK